MPPPLSSFSGLFNATAKPFVKNIGPLSSSVIRQQSYTTENSNNKPIVTESAVLNSFPRPNLQPTLQSSQTMSRLQMLKTLGATQTCFNCSGPHSTDYCPC